MSETTARHMIRESPDSLQQTPATCRTCRNCRRRKIKCNGQHPQCRACQLSEIDCGYPQDARRTAVRTKKADMRALQRKIEVLQGKLGERTDQSGPGDPLDTAPRTPGSSQTPLPGPGNSRPLNQIHVIPPEGAGCPVGPEINPPGTHRSSLFCTRGQGRIDTAASPETTLAEDGPQVYGATSLLHDQSSDTPLANRRMGDMETRFLSPDTIKDQLISNAAIRRQEELSLSSTPSIGANIDFDGVPMDLAMHLLELHWNRQHLSYLLTYRPAIMDSLVRNGPYVNKLLLNAIFLQSSLYSDRTSSFFDQDSNAKGLVFYDRFKSLLPRFLDNPTLPTTVAFLTCGACLVPYGYQSTGWALSGMGYQMIVDLGCHLEIPASSRGTALEQEMKKRVYWGAFVSDKLQSLFLGRPITMHESAGNVSQVYLDSFEEMEEWRPYVDNLTQADHSPVPPYRGRPSCAISTFHSLLQLCRITGHIIEAFYSVGSPKKSESELFNTKHDVTEQLETWRDNLPSWLRFDPTVDITLPPHQITPHALYWTLVILTEQAFLNRGRFNFSLNPESAEMSRQTCIQAALRIWRLVEAYKQAFTLRRAQYGISYATYCAALVILQHTRHDNAEHMECISFFSSALLDYQKGCCHGLKRPLKLLKSLMRRLESVTNDIEAEEPPLAWLEPSNATNTAWDPEVHRRFELEPWDTSLLRDIPDDLFLTDDSIFGMFGG